MVGYKWVFRTKYNYDGFVARYKASLVAKGYYQIEGFSFSETFGPMVKKATILLLLHTIRDPYIKWMRKFSLCMVFYRKVYTCVNALVLLTNPTRIMFACSTKVFVASNKHLMHDMINFLPIYSCSGLKCQPLITLYVFDLWALPYHLLLSVDDIIIIISNSTIFMFETSIIF